MKVFLHGKRIIYIDMISFDVILQTYILTIREPAIIEYWRRRVKKYDIVFKQYRINISSETPHVLKLEQKGLTSSEIMLDIFEVAEEYVIYALEKMAPNYINIVFVGDVGVEERLDLEEVGEKLQIDDIEAVKGLDIEMAIEKAY